VQLQLLQLGFWILVMVLVYGLDFLVSGYFLGMVALERDTLSFDWLLRFASVIIMSDKFKGARGWLRAYGWVTIFLYFL
jgi:hypothetical protein